MSCVNKVDKVNLYGGKKLLYNRKRYKKVLGKERLDLIKTSTTQDLGSYIEGMENMNSNTSEINQRIDKLRMEYDEILQDYNLAYQDYLADIKNRRKELDKNTNVNVTGRKTYSSRSRHPIRYHINKYGYHRQYDNRRRWVGSRSHQQLREKTDCPVGFMGRQNGLNVFDKTKEGVPLRRDVPCNLEGTMIRNQRTGQISWVHPDGSRRVVPNMDVFERLKDNGCPSEFRNLPDTIYSRIPTTGIMKVGDDCSYQLFSGKRNKVDRLNKQLLDKANELESELKKKMDSIPNIGGQVEGFENNKQEEIIQEMIKLNQLKDKLEKNSSRLDTYEREYIDSKKLINSKFYEYIFWIILVLGIGAFTMRQMTKN